MDIVKKVKPYRATYESLSWKNKILILFILISLVSIIVPHDGKIRVAKAQTNGQLVFAIGDYEDYLATVTKAAEKKYTHEQVVAKLRKQMQLAERVRQYLITQNSPLASHANTLIQQNNWKKILALSNAESSMCRKYPTTTNNCWGVGGSDLWQMGDNLDQGIVTMNRFLNNYPLRSSQKYTSMQFEQMNGLYKQPAAQHWVDNNMLVYNQLTALEKGL